ncbi:15191_t:CDS:2, partial [Entrophospora sp. SA101]
QLNALSSDLFNDVNDALEKYDSDPEIRAIVITGSEKAFAAGADIQEMADKTFAEVYKTNFLWHWGKINEIKKPIIAAVNAMSCDIIYAGEKAIFGQPEIKLGVIPGAGGTQRLTRAIGKSKAMEIILTGKNFTAQEAEQWGLVSKIFPVDKLLDESIKLGQEIAGFSQPVTQAAKESINKSFELSLKEGNHFERRLFQTLFALKDKFEVLTINNDINYEYSGPYEACSKDSIKGLVCIFEKINNSITETILSTKLGLEQNIGSGQINNDDNGKKYQFNNVLNQQPDYSSWIDRILYLCDIN